MPAERWLWRGSRLGTLALVVACASGSVAVAQPTWHDPRPVGSAIVLVPARVALPPGKICRFHAEPAPRDSSVWSVVGDGVIAPDGTYQAPFLARAGGSETVRLIAAGPDSIRRGEARVHLLVGQPDPADCLGPGQRSVPAWPDPRPPDAPPVPFRKVPVAFPDFARDATPVGTVRVRVLVCASGLVMATRVTRSLHPLLDQAAREALSRWVFAPARRGGRPVASWIEVPIVFRLL